MDVLVGTATGLIEAGSGRVVALAGEDVGAVAGRWAVVDDRRLLALDGPANRGPVLDGPANGDPVLEGWRITCLDARPGDQPIVGTAEAHLYRMGEEPVLVEAFDRAETRTQWYTPWGGPPDVRSLCTAPTGAILVNVHVGGILRSEDDGASWRATIDLDHDVHQVLALGGAMAVAACAHGLATSHDDGRTWAVQDEGLHATYSRAVAVAGETILLSVSTGPQGREAAVYRRALGSDGPFERCRVGLPDWFDGNVDTSFLAGAPDGSAALATRAGDVYVSTDEGATWGQAASGLASVHCVSVSPG
jgi:hypothetical protein